MRRRTVTQLFDADPAGITTRLWIGMVAAAVIAFLGVRTRTLSMSGAVAAVAVGTTIFAGAGLLLSAPLIAFFVSGSALSRIGGTRAWQARAAAVKTGERDAQQVLANGAIAALCALGIAACASMGLHHAARVFLLAAIAS